MNMETATLEFQGEDEDVQPDDTNVQKLENLFSIVSEYIDSNVDTILSMKQSYIENLAASDIASTKNYKKNIKEIDGYVKSITNVHQSFLRDYRQLLVDIPQLSELRIKAGELLEDNEAAKKYTENPSITASEIMRLRNDAIATQRKIKAIVVRIKRSQTVFTSLARSLNHSTILYIGELEIRKKACKKHRNNTEDRLIKFDQIIKRVEAITSTDGSTAAIEMGIKEREIKRVLGLVFPKLEIPDIKFQPRKFSLGVRNENQTSPHSLIPRSGDKPKIKMEEENRKRKPEHTSKGAAGSSKTSKASPEDDEVMKTDQTSQAGVK